MTFLPADSLEADADARARRQDARLAIQALKAILESPGLAHAVDLSVLTRLAADPVVPPRERRRAAEVLLGFRVKTIERLANLVGAREQSLAALGLGPDPQRGGAPKIIVNIGNPTVRPPPRELLVATGASPAGTSLPDGVPAPEPLGSGEETATAPIPPEADGGDPGTT